MKNTQLFFKSLAITSCCLMTVSVFGGTIVPDLNDADAVFSSTTPTTTGAGAYSPTLANGMTLAASFTPDATDLSNSGNGAVAVIETGGSTSGSGLWIVGGSLWFLSSSGNAYGLPASNTDVDGSDGMIGIKLDALTAGTQMDVFASFDGANGSLLVSQNSNVSSYSLNGVDGSWNWAGNKTSALGIADPTVTSNGGINYHGWDGGLADVDAGTSLFSDNNAVSLDGTVNLGQVFNAVSTVPVPEPGTSVLVALGLISLVGLRRRNK